MSELTTPTSKHDALNDLEVALAQLPPVELPVTHQFTPGIYVRQIEIPAGTMLTSMTHLTEHPFVLSQGMIKVTSDNEGSVTYQAPYTGITKPGTRRALHAITDVIWTTFHATEETDVEKICEQILAPHDSKHIEAATNEKFAPQYQASLPE